MINLLEIKINDDIIEKFTRIKASNILWSNSDSPGLRRQWINNESKKDIFFEKIKLIQWLAVTKKQLKRENFSRQMLKYIVAIQCHSLYFHMNNSFNTLKLYAFKKKWKKRYCTYVLLWQAACCCLFLCCRFWNELSWVQKSLHQMLEENTRVLLTLHCTAQNTPFQTALHRTEPHYTIKHCSLSAQVHWN